MQRIARSTLLKRSVLPQSFASRRLFHVSGMKKEEQKSTPPVDTEEYYKSQATAFLNSLPGADKPYSFVVGTSLAAILFGKEIIPYTGDVVYAIPFAIAIKFMYDNAGSAVGGLINSVEKEEEKIFNDAKTKAEVRLQEEIHQITGSGISDLVSVTESLFEHAEELTKLEAEAFEHDQKVQFYSKAKQILDEWVRYESALRDKEQKRIAELTIENVMKSIQDPKFQDRYLEQCISGIELALSK